MAARPVRRGSKIEEFVAHNSNVNCLALGHKSGRVLVTGGDDKKVNLWAVGKPHCIMSLSGHTTSVECVRFGNTEELVCAGSSSGAIKIWDLEAARLVRTLTGHKSNTRCIDFHPYGDFLASGSFDTNIKLWDIRRKGCIFTYKGHNQMVNSVKFSPDGQWIASAGEDGGVKLWDLRAGKMLTELVRHTGPVVDVEFHPHEFLVASGGFDRVVNLWDLENFQLVTSTDGECGPIRCIAFAADGDCVFAGCHDMLKVYGWEPFRSHDTVAMGWGKIADIAVAQTQLIGAAFHSSNVSVYMVDLKKVQPFGRPQIQPEPASAPPPVFRHNQHVRKSFIKEKPPDGNGNDMAMRVEESSDTNVNTDPEDDLLSVVDVKDQHDYTEIFRPRTRALNRTPPPEPAPPADPSPSLPPLPPSTPVRARLATPSGPGAPRASDLPPVSRSPAEPGPPSPPTAGPTDPPPSARRPPLGHTPPSPVRTQLAGRQAVYHSTPDVRPDSVPIPTEPYRPPPTGLRHSPSDPVIIRGGGPELAPVPTDTRPPYGSYTRHAHPPPPPAAALDPDMDGSNIVPMTGDKPSGLDIDDFLPNKFSRLGMGGGQYSSQSAVSEAEAFTSIVKGHDSMMSVLTGRHRQLEIAHSLWCSKDAKTALEHVVARNDLSVSVDLLSQLNLRPSIWNLDICQVLLPSIQEMLQSKYEMYMTIGCSSLKLILKNFAHMIKTNIESPVYTHGVDISREERYNKCKGCNDQLLSIRAFLLKRQTLQGKIGQTFRELQILMQALD
ncbi:katanin p80 WD40 repeat-containing subunit B1-like isoform X2 [Amphibalanus amphitrite]|uniref:katanin p80 WD40 repeat-containing subunit B1-like isoform X2 n=1 Tax=Amphibalanus amphitrite TaxID=1232801 RepID=UPI001C915286|nr:katanin p80 WD40 repeat-containing subunit B1-like isoform X2 [Amphibalanus amphitrite]XP_043224568.1 katanin p80 WD40 repeat-containing subunit B1-like isoform X2 [Amphibalanus amphitrite]XP_043224576.1 katanin p80 WD40 repeat-containing subunit B1-like isoform X2 [Amphibalanus amphitrite]XP_043224585.1 katanin p80 WD40 repeat-containing subunit B1-like isoform X2 [Amphibalanus amphitrite]XP_043224594.1 katanin p80 WD40 repeat-containing subunit B1-like isoform X2 [Amphibalanus amphitrite]